MMFGWLIVRAFSLYVVGVTVPGALPQAGMAVRRWRGKGAISCSPKSYMMRADS